MGHRSRVRFVPALLLPLLLAAVGCDDDDKAAPTSLAEVLSRLAAANCKLQVACATTPDLATCLASQDDPGALTRVSAEIAAGKVTYDGSKAAACVAWFESYYGSTTCTQSALAAVRSTETGEACAELIAGTVPAGGGCVFSEECAARGICQQTDPACVPAQQCCPGTCLARPTEVPVGGDCSATAPRQTCVAGAICLMAAPGAPYTCLVPSKVEGTACTSTFMCASPLFCDRDPATGAGTCRRAALSGAPCSTNISIGPCDDLREYCDPTTHTCKSRLAVGASCDVQRSGCIGYAACAGGTCVAFPKPGEACNATSGPDCLGTFECSTQTNTCAHPPASTCI